MKSMQSSYFRYCPARRRLKWILTIGLINAASAQEVVFGTGNECPEGRVKVTDETDCQNAQKCGPESVKNGGWAGSENEPEWPSGCYYCEDVDGCDDGTWFNTYPIGVENGEATSLCVLSTWSGCGGGTTSPTTAFQGEDYTFKNLETSFVDGGDAGFAISLNYTVGKTVDRVNVTLLDKNCTSETFDSIINLLADESAASSVHFLKKVSVNKQEFTKSNLVTRSEGSSKGTLSFCVKAEGLSENKISVSFQQDILNLSYDLTKNTFEVLSNGLKADDIDTTLTSVATSYSIIAHRCNRSSYEAIDQTTTLKQNGLVFICIKPNSTDVEISTFSLNFVQADNYTFSVVAGGKPESILSSVYSEGDKKKIVSRLVTALFDDAKETFDASGNVNLVFKTSIATNARMLSDEDNAGEASFGMKVKLEKRIDTQKQPQNIPKTALSVLGTCVMLSILFITIKKMKQEN